MDDFECKVNERENGLEIRNKLTYFKRSFHVTFTSLVTTT